MFGGLDSAQALAGQVPGLVKMQASAQVTLSEAWVCAVWHALLGPGDAVTPCRCLRRGPVHRLRSASVNPRPWPLSLRAARPHAAAHSPTAPTHPHFQLPYVPQWTWRYTLILQVLIQLRRFAEAVQRSKAAREAAAAAPAPASPPSGSSSGGGSGGQGLLHRDLSGVLQTDTVGIDASLLGKLAGAVRGCVRGCGAAGLRGCACWSRGVRLSWGWVGVGRGGAGASVLLASLCQRHLPARALAWPWHH